MKRNIWILIILIAIAVPNITFASWWNPTTWSIFSFLFNSTSDIQERTSTSTNSSIDNSQNLLLCNGQNYTKCPTGQTFTCPKIGDAYCTVPKIPETKSAIETSVHTTPTQTNNKDEQDKTAIEIYNKNRAIDVLSQIISSYTSLYNYIDSAINVMNNVNTSLLSLSNNEQAKLSINLTNAEINVFEHGLTIVKPLIDGAQLKLSQLDSQPLSYFLNYQISNDPDNFYSALNIYPSTAQKWVDAYNTYLSNVKVPTTVPYISQPNLHCNFASGNGTGRIDCY